MGYVAFCLSVTIVVKTYEEAFAARSVEDRLNKVFCLQQSQRLMLCPGDLCQSKAKVSCAVELSTEARKH